MSDLNKSPAELQTEVEQLREANAALKQRNLSLEVYAPVIDRVEDVEKQLITAQHRIKQLREVLERLRNSAAVVWIPPEEGSVQWLLLKDVDATLALTDSTAELDAGMKDAERLNWLESNPRHAQSLIDGNATDCVLYGISCAELVKLRDAIDAAMKEQP